MPRQFHAAPAERENMPLFIGIVGPSSSGKTRSAMELAVGIANVDPGPIAFINTEGKRGLLDVNLYKNPDGSPMITHIPFEPPFTSLDYLSAIEYARDELKAKTIIIDSMSHEHEQEGGMLDYQDQELKRLAGDDYGTWKADRFNMLAWQRPKADRRKLLTRGVMQSNCNIIACFRAKETSKPVKQDGKTKIVQMGFSPIAGEEFVFEMALSCLLLPGAEGVPTWESEHVGERQAMKRNGQMKDIVKDGERLSQDMGKRLALWARGLSDKPTAGIQDAAKDEAGKGRESFLTYYKSLSPPDKKAVDAIMPELKDRMAAHDKPVDVSGDTA